MSQMEEKISSLIKNDIGDLNRLNEMLERVKARKTLYKSDMHYIEKLMFKAIFHIP